MGQLNGRSALVIGAAGGIGSAIARLFARAGAAQHLVDTRPERLRELVRELDGSGAAVSAGPIDVTDPESVQASVTACAERHGAVDILVNCAGVIEEVRVESMSLDQWDRLIAVNLTGVFLTCRAVVPLMRRRSWGRIITISSQVGQIGGAGASGYAAAKAGVIGFTKSLAREVARDGVLVNSIAPGPVDTGFADVLSPQTLAAKAASLPLGRTGQAAEVAPTALLLASEPAGNLYVGQTLGPNCGDVML